MQNPKISIIIPVYNAEKTLRHCLDSVLNQTYENYEVIVVDNNSSDKSRNIIQEYCARNNRIKYIFETKKGAAAARYRGERNSKGDIILMTDSDCIIPNNWIEEMMGPIVKDNRIAVQGLKKPIVLNYWTKHIQDEEERLAMERIKDGKIGLLDTANFAIKRSVLQEVGYANPNVSIGHDTELEVRLKIKGYEIFFKPVEVLHYHRDVALKIFKNVFKKR